MKDKIRIMVVDDHFVVRIGLAGSINIEPDMVVERAINWLTATQSEYTLSSEVCSFGCISVEESCALEAPISDKRPITMIVFCRPL